jgi:Raf kinase inhibitor-like YbhB/YbcL family protein
MAGAMSRRVDEAARSTTPTEGELALASHRLGAWSLPRFQLSSSDFQNGELLPTRCSTDGDGSPPVLSWGVLDPRPGSFALICEDPDVTRSAPFVHWLVYGISGSTTSLDSNLNDFKQGLNDKGDVGFAPAAPPRGQGVHRYCFQLFALDTELNFPEGRDYDRLLSALSGHVVVWGELIGRYERF